MAALLIKTKMTKIDMTPRTGNSPERLFYKIRQINHFPGKGFSVNEPYQCLASFSHHGLNLTACNLERIMLPISSLLNTEKIPHVCGVKNVVNENSVLKKTPNVKSPNLGWMNWMQMS